MNAYNFVVASVHPNAVATLVVVKKTMSPATVGALDGRSPLVSGLDEADDTAVRLRVNVTVPSTPGLLLSFNPISLNVPEPPGVVLASRSLPVPKNRYRSDVPTKSSADDE